VRNIYRPFRLFENDEGVLVRESEADKLKSQRLCVLERPVLDALFDLFHAFNVVERDYAVLLKHV